MCDVYRSVQQVYSRLAFEQVKLVRFYEMLGRVAVSRRSSGLLPRTEVTQYELAPRRPGPRAARRVPRAADPTRRPSQDPASDALPGLKDLSRAPAQIYDELFKL